MTTDISQLRKTAAQILAAAVLELFPETLLIIVRETTQGFYGDFVLPFSITEAQLKDIEERMGQIVRERRPIKMIEMVPQNAAALFAHKGQHFLAERCVEQQETLLTLFQMGEYYAESEPCTLMHSGAVSAFRLLEFSTEHHYHGQLVTRIFGTAFSEKDEVKQFLKKWRSYAGRDHLIIGKELDLFSQHDKRFVWHPRGENLRHRLGAFLRAELMKQKFSFIFTAGAGADLAANHHNYFVLSRKQYLRLAECRAVDLPEEGWERGLLTPTHALIDRATIFCSEERLEEECISSLQFIMHMLKIFHFKSKFVLSSSGEEQKAAASIIESALRHLGVEYVRETSVKRTEGPIVEVRIADGMGQEWPGPFVGIDGRFKAVVCSFFNSFERWIALMLENAQGELPFWLVPEQIRVIGMKDSAYVHLVLQKLQMARLRVAIDVREEKFTKKLHEALKVKIPWLVVVGEQEEKKQCITVRSCSSPDAEEINIEEFIERMKVPLENQ